MKEKLDYPRSLMSHNEIYENLNMDKELKNLKKT